MLEYTIAHLFQGLAGNEMQTEGARIVDDVLKKITCLTHLNLAGIPFCVILQT